MSRSSGSRIGRAALVAAVVSALLVLVPRPPAAGAAPAPGSINLQPAGPSQPIGPPAGSPMGVFHRDAGISTPLSDGRTLWVYADTTLDGVYASLRGTAAIGTPPSPLALWEPTGVDGGGNVVPASHLLDGPLPPCPAGQQQFAWPMSAVTVPQGGGKDQVLIFFQTLCGAGFDVAAFTTQTMGVARLDYDAVAFPTTTGLLRAQILNAYLFPPAANRTPLPPGYGAAAAYKDGYVYVWQCSYPGLPPTCQVGRTTPANVADPNSYTFWDGSIWIPVRAAAATLSLPGPLTGFFKPSIDYVPSLGAWVWVDGDFPQQYVYVRTAPAPQGPWSVAARIPTPECTAVNCRAPELHEQLSTPDALAISYIDVTKLPEHRMLYAPIVASPFGSFDSAAVNGVGTAGVSGWVIDGDQGTTAVHLYVNGAYVAALNADQQRNDIGAAYPAYGSFHGFSGTVPIGGGTSTVCAYGINVGLGVNRLLGCKEVIDLRPFGSLDAVTAASPTDLQVRGWAIDPDTTAAVNVQIAVDGVTVATVAANQARPDVGAAYPASGPLHGFSTTVPVSSAVHQVCATAVNVASGSGNTLLGCRNASPLPAAPTAPAAAGGVEQATVSWSPPVATGGLAIDAYVVTPSTGGTITVPGVQTSTTVTGLPGGASVSFTVAARTAAGTGPASAPTNAVVPTAAPGAGFHAVAPYRVLDSRTALGGWGGAPLGPGEVRDLVVAATGGPSGVPASARAVVLNVTVTGGTQASYLTAFPSGAVPPTAANLLFAPGQTVPNLVTAKVGNGGKVSFFNQLGSVHVIADVVGWYDDGTTPGDRFTGVTPTRVLDTRNDTGGPGGAIGGGLTRNLTVTGTGGVPGGATAVVLNITATGGSAGSYLRVTPTGSTPGTTANVLFAAGQTVPNLVTVGVGTGGQVAIFNQLGSVHVIADVVGYYDGSPGGGLFHALSPTRLLDSRTPTGGWSSTPLGANQARGLTVTGGAVPGAATGIVLNATATGGTQASYLAVSPAPGPVPAPTASLLFAAGQTVPNAAVVRVPGSGQVDLYNQRGSVHVIVDAAGWFGPT